MQGSQQHPLIKCNIYWYVGSAWNTTEMSARSNAMLCKLYKALKGARSQDNIDIRQIGRQIFRFKDIYACLHFHAYECIRKFAWDNYGL